MVSDTFVGRGIGSQRTKELVGKVIEQNKILLVSAGHYAAELESVEEEEVDLDNCLDML